ncbi:LepB GTPase-activating domain-containing protein [Legionella sp. 16cNR16C]|uniref:LepB GTPase-activating domain-containing protein n=1 Tax=Legionella sp. 16cNR16C TaxID=2905656 RepID=UPI001E5ADC76|nr:LepB GTPase-activating domain-containing protein [Legionella sp. 16cNR16C]MCE3045293.1 LepB GTPase-activating domain-containing protein [Legionella sp. 16cNR16C]
MLHFNQLNLEKTGDKTGGKNKVGGFYRNTETGEEYFIKQPDDKAELLTELLAGLILQEFVKRGLVDKLHASSLICADVVQMPDGSYALIQPKVDFELLYKIINTGYRDGSDRDPRIEATNGPAYYMSLLNTSNTFGLSTTLMLSMLLGDYSVHSGNMVRMTKNIDGQVCYQYGKIDWGAAFRNYGKKENTDFIIYGYESIGAFNLKGITKAYFLNYRYIPGLFETMAERARQLNARLPQELLIDIIHTALNEIPADLLKTKKPGQPVSNDSPDIDSPLQQELPDSGEQKTLATLAKDTSINSFNALRLGDEESTRELAQEMAAIMGGRLDKMETLKTPEDTYKDKARKLFLTAPDNSMHTSIYFPQKPDPSVWEEPFPILVKEFIKWTYKDEFGQINISAIVNQLNSYIDFWAQQGELFNLWGNQESNQNIFTPYAPEIETEALRGHAYLPQYREATLLRRMAYSYLHIDEAHPLGVFITHRIALYEGAIERYVKTHPDSYWVLCQNAITEAQAIVNNLHVLQKIQSSPDAPPLNEEHLKEFKDAVSKFLHHNKKLEESFQQIVPQKTDSEKYSSEFFYPFEEDELKALSGDQLATICLEELNARKVSSLLTRIVSNDELYLKVQAALSKDVFTKRVDSPAGKTAELAKFYLFINTYKQFSVAETYLQKQEERLRMAEQLKKLDTNLQEEAQLLLQQADDRLLALHQLEIDYEQALETFQSDISLSTLELLKSHYEMLPSDVKKSKEQSLEMAEKSLEQLQLETAYILSLEKYEQHSTSEHFELLKTHYEKLKEPQQVKHQASYQKASEKNETQLRVADYQGRLSEFDKDNTLTNLSVLDAAFQALPDEHKPLYQKDYDKAVRFMNFKELYDEISEDEVSVQRFLEISDQLLIKYAGMDNANKELYQGEYEKLLEKAKHYKILVAEKVVSKETPVKEINPVLKKVFSNPDLAGNQIELQLFRQQLLSDQRLWNAVKASTTPIKPGIAADLVTLKQFHDQRVLKNHKNKYGDEYTASLDRFYAQTLETRLSDQPIKEQAEAMKKAAKKEFQPRHSTRRFIADLAMVFTTLFGGVFVGLGRKAAGKTYFFSSTEVKTTREQDFDSMLNKEQKKTEEESSETLFKKPFSGG